MKCYLCGEETTICNPWGDYLCKECYENIIKESNRIANLDHRNRCIELDDAVYDLIKIIEIEEKGQLPEFYYSLNIMRKNLRICIQNNFEDIDELIPLLTEDWENCWHVHCGLDEWFIYRGKYEDRIEANTQLKKVKIRIEKLMNFKQSSN